MSKHRINYKCHITVEVECDDKHRILGELGTFIGNERSGDQIYTRNFLQEVGLRHPQIKMNIWTEALPTPKSWLEQKIEEQAIALKDKYVFEGLPVPKHNPVLEEMMKKMKRYEHQVVFPIVEKKCYLSMEVIETLMTRLPNPDTCTANFVDMKLNNGQADVRFHKHKSDDGTVDWYLEVVMNGTVINGVEVLP